MLHVTGDNLYNSTNTNLNCVAPRFWETIYKTQQIITLSTLICRLPNSYNITGKVYQLMAVSYTHLDVYKRQAQYSV